MALVLNEEQRMLQESAADFFKSAVTIGQLRALRDEPGERGFDPQLWAQMVELGWAAIPWPEAYGGLEFGYQGLGLVSAQAGRQLATTPMLGNVWLSGTLINEAGNELQKQSLLSPLIAGELIVATALDEHAHFNPYSVATRLQGSPDSLSVSGRKRCVLNGADADKLLVLARSGGQDGTPEGLTLVIVDADAPGIVRRSQLLADSQRVADIEFSDVSVTPDAILGELGKAAPVLERALAVAAIGACAEMLGGLSECFERTVEYLKEREQFGAPIGSFQGLKHRAAELFCEVELSQSVVLEALSALDDGRPAEDVQKLASLAKSQVGEASHRISREGIQMHGGIGMTDEFDIGFFMKRSAVLEQLFGGSDFHRNRYGALEGI